MESQASDKSLILSTTPVLVLPRNERRKYALFVSAATSDTEVVHLSLGRRDIDDGVLYHSVPLWPRGHFEIDSQNLFLDDVWAFVETGTITLHILELSE